jgi:hypothetical protein
VPSEADAVPPARGRRAPPPEVRQALQRQRLLRAAALEFAERGYAGAAAVAVRGANGADAEGRLKASVHAFLAAVSEHPEFAQTLLVEIIGAGPRAAQRRDEVMQTFADALDAENARAARRGLGPRFASPYSPLSSTE